MATEVTDAPDRSRYEIREDGALLGFAAYRRSDGRIVFTHTEIEPGNEGKGVGSTLVRRALDDVRARELPVEARCPFVSGWMAKHPEYLDLDHRRRPAAP